MSTVISQSNFRKSWNRVLTTLELPHCTPHSLRASFVDIWVDKGMPFDKVRDMAGHENISVTMNTYKGTADIHKLSRSVMAVAAHHASEMGDLGAVVNAASGVVLVEGLHADGSLASVTGLPSMPAGADADVLPMNTPGRE